MGICFLLKPDTTQENAVALSNSRKKKRASERVSTLKEIQNMFSDDKGWDSEESMIVEMAEFRKERLGL